MDTNSTINTIQTKLRDLRDNQTDVPCVDGEPCICNKFDIILDALDDLKNEMGGKK